MMVKKNFTAQYKQTILGPLWAIINPLLTTIVLNLVFGKMAKLTIHDSTEAFAIPAFLFYMSGNICWIFFSSILQSVSNTFLENRATMGKVYYPRIVAPVATALSKLISFAIQLLLFACIMVYELTKGTFVWSLTWKLLLVPVLVLQIILLSLGCGIIISSVTTKYRDLSMLVGFGLGLWQYACPIAYGLQLVPAAYRKIYMLNPLTPILTTFRYAVFGSGYFDWYYYAISWCITIAIVSIGLILFSRIERTFMDTI